MNPMAPHGSGIDFTWVLTIGVVVYSFISFVAYLIYSAFTGHKIEGTKPDSKERKNESKR